MAPDATPPLPATVEGVLGPITVVRVPNLFADEEEYGSWVWATRVVSIDADLVGRAAWHILHHELVHAAIDDCGVKLDAAQEEAVCDAIATARVRERFG